MRQMSIFADRVAAFLTCNMLRSHPLCGSDKLITGSTVFVIFFLKKVFYGFSSLKMSSGYPVNRLVDIHSETPNTQLIPDQRGHLQQCS